MKLEWKFDKDNKYNKSFLADYSINDFDSILENVLFIHRAVISILIPESSLFLICLSYIILSCQRESYFIVWYRCFTHSFSFKLQVFWILRWHRKLRRIIQLRAHNNMCLIASLIISYLSCPFYCALTGTSWEQLDSWIVKICWLGQRLKRIALIVKIIIIYQIQLPFY